MGELIHSPFCVLRGEHASHEDCHCGCHDGELTDAEALAIYRAEVRRLRAGIKRLADAIWANPRGTDLDAHDTWLFLGALLDGTD